MDDVDNLENYPQMPIDKSKIDIYTDACIHRGVTYGMGDKDPVLGAFPPDYAAIDCSGFIRTLIYYVTGGKVKMPDGSWNEGNWLTNSGYLESTFEDSGLQDDVVRLCVYEKTGATGHIWLTHQGQTYESHGGVGVGRREWDNNVMISIAAHTRVWAVA